jgi:hypothetical protein
VILALFIVLIPNHQSAPALGPDKRIVHAAIATAIFITFRATTFVSSTAPLDIDRHCFAVRLNAEE